MAYKEEADYAITYFSDILTNRENLKKYSKKIIDGLKNGKKQYKDLLDTMMFFDDGEDKLLELFRDDYKNFKEKVEEGELPF